MQWLPYISYNEHQASAMKEGYSSNFPSCTWSPNFSLVAYILCYNLSPIAFYIL